MAFQLTAISSLWKKVEEDPENQRIICFFRFQSMEDCSCAYEALCKHFVVFLDLSGMREADVQRLKDYMWGVCASLHADYKEICEDYIVYFPKEYQLQIFES